MGEVGSAEKEEERTVREERDLIETFFPTIEILVAYKHSQVSFTKLNLAKRR